MARQDFLAGLGAALLNVSDSSRANRAEDFQKAQAKQREEMEVMRMALSRDQFKMDQEQFGLQKEQHAATQQRDARSLAKDIVAEAGPNGMLDDVSSQKVVDGDYGFRLAPRQDGTLDSKPFVMDTINMTAPVTKFRPEASALSVESPGMQMGAMQQESPGLSAGRRVIPTSDQQFQIETQEKARNIEATRLRAEETSKQPGVWDKANEMQRASLWAQLQYDGPAPTSTADWEARERFKTNQQLRVVGAQNDGRVAAAEARALATERGKTLKPPTGMQSDNLKFYNRMQLAADKMTEIEDGGELSEADLGWINNSSIAPALLVNYMKSPAGKQYATALNTYTEGRLRDESGAAIPPHEYAQDRQTISRQVFDDDDALAYKRQVRQTTLDGAAFSAGSAYELYYGRPTPRGKAPNAKWEEAQALGVEGGVNLAPGGVPDAPALEVHWDRDPKTGLIKMRKPK